MSVQGVEQPRTREPASGGAGRVLLELDPDLGRLLPPERREAAQRELRVRVTTFPVGEWDGGRLADADPVHLGLLVVEGVLAREVVLLDMVSTELLGPGDIVRPWQIEGPPELLPVGVRWNALSTVRFALLDRRAGVQLGRYPEICAVIVDRLSERAQRLSITQAISQLNRVDRRLLALFWHLAERWGRVSRGGIIVPLALSHRVLGELVGARRPTVSTALAELARHGQLIRGDDGTWLLTGQPVSDSAAAVEVIRQRRTPMPRLPKAYGELPTARLDEMRPALDGVRAIAADTRAASAALQADSAALQRRIAAMRAERARQLEALRAAAVARRGVS